jgi:hypothetical protein
MHRAGAPTGSLGLATSPKKPWGRLNRAIAAVGELPSGAWIPSTLPQGLLGEGGRAVRARVGASPGSAGAGGGGGDGRDGDRPALRFGGEAGEAAALGAALEEEVERGGDGEHQDGGARQPAEK